MAFKTMQPVSVSNSNLFGTNYKLPALWAKEVGEFSNVVSVSENPRFCGADFAMLSDERRSRSKPFLLFNMDKRTLRSKI